MKRLAIISAYLLAGTFLSLRCKQPAAREATLAADGISVVELFTSEGCSSCPAADALVAKIKKEKNDVLVLAYHVDYWDRLGWKDAFSQPQFSERQRQYARQFKLEGVYTPQVVVNGKIEFVGSNEGKLRNALQNKIGGQLQLQASIKSNVATVEYSGVDATASIINFAIIQPQATTQVKRGENGGRSLSHVNIVRVLKSVKAADSGSIQLNIPDGLDASQLQLIAFTQNNDLSVGAAKQVSL